MLFKISARYFYKHFLTKFSLPLKREGQDTGPVLRHRTSNCNATLYYSHPDISSKRTLTKIPKPLKNFQVSSEFVLN